jgi:hypothetical protein
LTAGDFVEFETRHTGMGREAVAVIVSENTNTVAADIKETRGKGAHDRRREGARRPRLSVVAEDDGRLRPDAIAIWESEGGAGDEGKGPELTEDAPWRPWRAALDIIDAAERLAQLRAGTAQSARARICAGEDPSDRKFLTLRASSGSLGTMLARLEPWIETDDHDWIQTSFVVAVHVVEDSGGGTLHELQDLDEVTTRFLSRPQPD